MLELRNLTRRFGGVVALSDVSFSVPSHGIFGIIGPNGAGKTTLLNMISGVTAPSSGQVLLDGRRIDRLPAYRIARRGVARTFQQVRLAREATVLEHLLIAQHSRGKSSLWQELLFATSARRERAERLERARALLRLVQLEGAAQRPAVTLSYCDQRRLEIARALAQSPRYLLLDEPAAGMTERERRDLERLLQEVVLEGVSVVLVEHDMAVAMDVCDRIAVLNVGQLLAEGRGQDICAHPDVIRAYLGE